MDKSSGGNVAAIAARIFDSLKSMAQKSASVLSAESVS